MRPGVGDLPPLSVLAFQPSMRMAFAPRFHGFIAMQCVLGLCWLCAQRRR
jgi:hypothetical protein